jgi:hypothetical protein
MRRTTIAVGLAFFLHAAAAADETPPPELAGAVSRLAVAIEHMSVAMDKQAANGSDARDRERVQVAVEILGLRMRKVERLESGALQLKNEADDMRNQLAILKTQISESDDERRQEGRELTAEERTMQVSMQRGLAMAEARIKSMEERKSGLEAELDAELRGLSTLEAILNDWLKQQR